MASAEIKTNKIENLILEKFSNQIKKGGTGEDLLDTAYRMLELMSNFDVEIMKKATEKTELQIEYEKSRKKAVELTKKWKAWNRGYLKQL
jgi:hypothetical protein